MNDNLKVALRGLIRDVPDFPKAGIIFKDITPLLANPEVFTQVVGLIASEWVGKIDVIAALDARGFIFGGAVAMEMHTPLVILRKKGKLPGQIYSISYGLEYGTDTLEMHKDALKPGMRVLVIDDLLATGGTAKAARDLIKLSGARVVGYSFIVELDGLGGRERLNGCTVQSLVLYEKETM